MDDKTIIATLLQDEEAGYTLLMERYASYVAAIVSGIAGGRLSPADMEELAADVFFRVWRRREQLKGESLKAYIAQTARNASIDRLRRRGEDFLPYEDDVLQVAGGSQPHELAFVREQKRIVETVVESLGEPDREIFIRFYYFGEKIKGIADGLRLNASTVKTKLRRTRLTLRDILRERGYECE